MLLRLIARIGKSAEINIRGTLQGGMAVFRRHCDRELITGWWRLPALRQRFPAYGGRATGIRRAILNGISG